MTHWTTAPKKPSWPEPTRPEHQPSQHHLQTRDRYAEELLAFRLAAVAPCSWGLAELAIDREALSRGVFRVTHLLGRFASGAIAFVSPRRPLVTSIPPPASGSAAITVHLALPPTSSDGPSVTDDDSSSRAIRFRRVRPRSGDPFLQPEIRLGFDDDDADRYERLALARIVLHGGRAELDPDFVPPMVRVLADSFLPGAVESVRGALVRRQDELLEARRARPFSIGDFRAAQAPSFLLLSAVNQALAVLTGPLASALRPKELHATLSELLGALEALDGRASEKRAVPAYNHDAAGPGFRTIVDRLLAVIPRVARVPHRSFPLRRVDHVTFAGAFDAAETFGKGVYIVASGMDEATLQMHLTVYAKVASSAMLPSIVQTAVRGVALFPEFDPPPSIPSSSTHVCFRLDTRSAYWTDILAQRSIAIHVPNIPPHFELVLYALTDDPRH